ncbi:porin [Otariodibacter oris]|uniref:Putative porin n=1 Tax=Otariodibacter oris TaxID=1032623 RepID=A0A420XIP6_9PAST|nr:porin [Otariodibacter oris]QGM80618.1 hypothetical protein A6A10_03975 [Otariodibacter oris]RKR77225.1 putative porin [Otariodibacter oris]
MKKTILSLAIATFATSASALTIYDVDGTKVDFSGSLRLRLDNEKSTVGIDRNLDAVDPQKANKFRSNAGVRSGHTNLHNDGSRLEVRAEHKINDDLSAFGRLEFRFNGARDDKGVDDFGSIYANRAYIALQSKTFGDISFGRQILIGDDIPQAGFDKAYNTFDTAMVTSASSAIRYNYRLIKGLQLSVDYRFADKRDSNGEVSKNGVKSGYDVGGLYTFDVAENQSITLATGYSRTNFVRNTNNDKHHKDAWAAGAKYKINNLELAVDYTGHFDTWQYNEELDQKQKEILNGFRVGARYFFTPNLAAYGNYGYRLFELKGTNQKLLRKAKLHRWLLGVSYKPHKQIETYVEAGILTGTRHNYEDQPGNILAGTTMKPRENKFGAGLRIFW